MDDSGFGATGVQLLTEQGVRVEHPDFAISLTNEGFQSLLRDMTLVRRLDAEATALQRQGELGLWASCLGQEAAQVGSAHAMAASDYAFPTYREHGVAWVRGVPPLEMLAMLRGVTNGGWDPNRYRCAPSTIVIGNQVLHAVGYAMGIQLDGSQEPPDSHPDFRACRRVRLSWDQGRRQRRPRSYGRHPICPRARSRR